jgi:hypothetical protein
MSREEYRAWKEERKDAWRARKAEWKAQGGRYRPGYGWHPVNIAAMVIGFIVFFPIGLAILFWNIWSAKNDMGRDGAGFSPMMAGAGGLAGAAFGQWDSTPWSQTSRDLARDSGNRVFEDYKRATLDRLEEERRRLVAEQQAFGSFLDDLRRAKDREEFERFMREREARQAEADRSRTTEDGSPSDR